MKRALLSSFGRTAAVLMALMLMPVTTRADVEINETNFPGENFRAYLLKQDYGQDGIITDEEIGKIESIDVFNKRISSLEGINFFTALEHLDCSFTQLTALDVSGCTALKTLNCQHSQLNSLDVSGCRSLQVLKCHENRLTKLNLSGCTSLKTLDCQDNQLASIDVSESTALSSLRCFDNQLTSLDVSGFTALHSLECSSNQLTTMNVSGCTALSRLWCNNNQLSTLDVSGCTALKLLECYYNQLNALDVSGCTALLEMFCQFNQMTVLNVTGCTQLERLECFLNQLRGESMDAFIASLPEVKTARLIVYIENFEDSNVCTKDNVADARAKGWRVYYWSDNDSHEYDGMDPESVADVEADGNTDTPVYDLGGRKLQGKPAQKGIYVKDGRKILYK